MGCVSVILGGGVLEVFDFDEDFFYYFGGFIIDGDELVINLSVFDWVFGCVFKVVMKLYVVVENVLD